MDGLTFNTALDVLSKFGVLGLVIYLWWQTSRQYQKMLAEFQKTTMQTLEAYREDTRNQARMYENNVELVKNQAKMAESQQDLIILSTRAMEKLGHLIENNQYCPAIRLERKGDARR